MGQQSLACVNSETERTKALGLVRSRVGEAEQVLHEILGKTDMTREEVAAAKLRAAVAWDYLDRAGVMVERKPAKVEINERVQLTADAMRELVERARNAHSCLSPAPVVEVK